MSLKIERDTLKQGPAPSNAPSRAPPGGPLPGTSGKHPIAETIGTAITGGKDNAGTKGYLAVSSSHCLFGRNVETDDALPFFRQAYIKQLEENPLRTKMLTAGTLAGAQELIASWLAKDRNKHGNYFTSRVPKMAAYGALISAPLGHVLIWCLQKAFKGRTSLRAKILQILVSNLIVGFLPVTFWVSVDAK
jgi:hypothetical protein